jgi:hypothetical protein
MPRHQQSLAMAVIVVLALVVAYLTVRHNEAVGSSSASINLFSDQPYASSIIDVIQGTTSVQ